MAWSGTVGAERGGRALVVLGGAGEVLGASAEGRSWLPLEDADALAEARRRLGSGRQVIVRLSGGPAEAPRFGYLVDGPAAARLAADAGLEPGAAVLVLPAPPRPEPLWDGLRDSFGVTAAEIRLAARLKDGLTLREGAEDLGVSLNTARNQLKSIFEKMGLRRQSDLVRTLGQLGALARMPDAA